MERADRRVPKPMSPTVRLTTAQAIVRYLGQQHTVADGERRRSVPAMLGIFGHGNVAGLGQALDEFRAEMPYVQGRNEQSLVHVATAYCQGVAPTSPASRDRVGRARGNEHDHRRRARHDQPRAGTPPARRHLRDPAPGTRPPTAGEPVGRRRQRERLLPTGGSLLRPDHPPGARSSRRCPRRCAS